jgi:hypothetical protein
MEHTRTFHTLPYEDASTPEEMYGDCAAAGARLHVPAPRRMTRAHALTPGAMPAHSIVVDPTAARLASSLFDGD